METKVKKLFNLIKEQTHKNAKVEEIIRAIKSDENLIEASNSYCTQCGNCCNKYCGNKEVRKDGLTYCLLQDDSGKMYPYEKQVPEYGSDIYQKLDPNVWAKPKTCHTSGPYLGLLTILEYQKKGNVDMEIHHKHLCPGGREMLEDFEKFRSS